uniref:Mitochondrial import receptor subunit TOM22 homolog n=1 Tax=Plectus sambesii TaxID=2011161 RepID=A0A914WQB6_9BILA
MEVVEVIDRRVEEELDDEDVEETLGERFVGLGEMFPDWLRRGIVTSANLTWSLATNVGSFAKSTLWIVSTSAMIMVVPYAIEKERSDMEKSQMAQQRQLLLGPSAAVSAAKANQLGPY